MSLSPFFKKFNPNPYKEELEKKYGETIMNLRGELFEKAKDIMILAYEAGKEDQRREYGIYKDTIKEDARREYGNYKNTKVKKFDLRKYLK